MCQAHWQALVLCGRGVDLARCHRRRRSVPVLNYFLQATSLGGRRMPACTYAVVVFSIVVQGLTMRRVLRHYGIAERR